MTTDDNDGRDDDRDPKPEPFSFLLGPEPVWLTCSCGQLTARVPCWDCTREAEVAADHARARKVSLATIPPRYEWARLASPDLGSRVTLRQPKAGEPLENLEDLAKRVLASERVVFAGPSGAGKTSFAIACLRERIPHGIFVSAMKLGTARIQGKAGDGEAPLVERAMTAPLLLLDEVGGEAKTANNAVKDVIFARMDADLPTWITTGFKGSELEAMYGDGTLRRLTENVTLVQFGAKR